MSTDIDPDPAVTSDAVTPGAAPRTPLADDVLTRTEEAVLERSPTARPGAGQRSGPGRRSGTGRRRKPWWRRRPVRRTLVFLHRWPTMILGLFLVIETTTGAVVLYHAEWFRHTHQNLYHHTQPAAGRDPVSLQQASEIVTKAHPGFAPLYVAHDKGVIMVVGAKQMWAVDPGSGHVNGAGTDGGVMGVLENIHDCALTCTALPGSVSWLGRPVPTLGIAWLTGITWAAAILVVLGLLMVLLAISGVIVWWPGRKRLSHGFRVRTGRGRFARDYDLHNVIGIVAVPLILMWGVTGAAFYAPAVQKAWITITGGHYVDSATEYAFAPKPAAKNAPVIGLDAAVARAEQVVPGGTVAYVSPPLEPAAPYYEVSLRRGHSVYGHRLIYSGDRTVYVDAHDPSHTKLVDGRHNGAANTFYMQIFEGAHFGWFVNGWWRIILFVFGLTPLVLMITGISTFLFRHGTRRRKNAAARARAELTAT